MKQKTNTNKRKLIEVCKRHGACLKKKKIVKTKDCKFCRVEGMFWLNAQPVKNVPTVGTRDLRNVMGWCSVKCVMTWGLIHE